MVQAHAYWRLKGLAVDLVIWNEDHAGYRQVLHDQIMGLISAGVEANVMDRPGGIFVRTAEQMSVEDRLLQQSVARVILTDRRGTLADQITRLASPRPRPTASNRRVPIAPIRRPPSSPERICCSITVSAGFLPMAASTSSPRQPNR